MLYNYRVQKFQNRFSRDTLDIEVTECQVKTELLDATREITGKSNMENLYGEKVKNKILSRLFTKAEIAWGLSDISRSIGPMIDLIFISQFIGINGVTVMGYVAPLIMLLGFIGTNVANGARVKTAPFLGAGNLPEANRIFSNAVILGGLISLSTALLIAVFSDGVCFLLGVRDYDILEMTRQYIFGYIIGLPFLTLAAILTPYLELEGQYRRVCCRCFHDDSHRYCRRCLCNFCYSWRNVRAGVCNFSQLFHFFLD